MLCYEHCDIICVWHCRNIASLLNLLLHYIYFPLQVFYFRVDFSKCFIACITCTYCCVFIHDHVSSIFCTSYTYILFASASQHSFYFFPSFSPMHLPIFLYAVSNYCLGQRDFVHMVRMVGIFLRVLGSITQLDHQAFFLVVQS